VNEESGGRWTHRDTALQIGVPDDPETVKAVKAADELVRKWNERDSGARVEDLFEEAAGWE